MSVKCPRCQNEVEDLIKVEPGLRLRIQELGLETAIPDQICVSCFGELSGGVSKGAQLRAEINAKDHNKKVLWKNRISLVKSGRERMYLKAYAEAAMLYEKYIRTVELMQDKPAGQLDPQGLIAMGHEKELTILVSVYWDLIRIYDSNYSYMDKLQAACAKLLEILPLTAAGIDIVKRGERFVKTANNHEIVKRFMKEAEARTDSQKCFIANAAFENPYAPEVQILRAFRDQVLRKSLAGKAFVQVYYFVSPPLAKWLRSQSSLQKYVRYALSSFATQLSKRFNLKSQ